MVRSCRGAGFALSLILATVFIFPRIVLPVATPVNWLANLREIPAYPLLDTPLVSTAGVDYDNSEELEYSLDTATHIDVRGRGNKTALIAAAQHGNTANVRVLLDHGADASLRDHEGMTALDYARARVKGGNREFEAVVDRLRGEIEPGQ